MSQKRTHLVHLVTSAMLIALGLLLPFLTGQIPEIGNMLCPMHIPVLLAGFFCGPLFGAVVGVATPLLRSFLFGMPPLFPKASAMAVELLVYGLCAGLLYLAFRKKRWSVYPSLVLAMLAGRAAWGLVSILFYGMRDIPFGWAVFFTEAFVNAIPGIILQLILIPLLVLTLEPIYRKIAR